MDLLIILTYVAFAWAMFKIFKIPVNKWTIPTAALGGIFIVSGLILLMNYNHPYTFKAQKAVISIPVVPQVTGVVIEVTDKKNTLIKKGEVLFRLDPTRYQARVDRLMADIVTAEHKQRALGAELDEMAANTQQAKATRDKFAKEYQRYARGSQAKVNPFSERDIDVARQNYLAQEASVKSSAAEQKQIQSQLDSLVLGEHSQIASLKAQLAEAKYNLEQTIVRAPSDGYVTQVLIRPGTYAASLPLEALLRGQTDAGAEALRGLPFEGRLSVVEFLLHSLQTQLRVMEDASALAFSAESFLKSIPAGEGYAACAEKQLENRRAALQIRRECGVLSAEDERRETAFLTRVDAALAARSDAEAFEAVRLLAETSGTAAEQSRQNTLAALENGLRFIHETFGEEQELWILLHGLRECGAAAFLQKENSAVYRELLSNASPEARAAALREELKR